MSPFVHAPSRALTPVAQHNVPTFGAILLNAELDKCLMVKGWKSGASWGFPKGKVCPAAAVPMRMWFTVLVHCRAGKQRGAGCALCCP